MKRVVVYEKGGPENLVLEDARQPTPGPDQALVRIAYSGVNFIDTYFRTGLYPADNPITIGQEAAGTVEAVGSNVRNVKPGQRVAYAMARGSYAEYQVVPAWQLIPVPDGVDLKLAAAAMLQGMTAHYLTHSTFPLKQGDTCLIHAAAGGVGLLLVQMAKTLGARVIGTVGSQEKVQQAREAGADELILYKEQDFVAETKRLTNNKGVDVVYDSVGATTFLPSLDCLRPRGMMATFGNASGPAPAFSPLVLNQKGSLFVTRPSLAHYASTPEELAWRASDVLNAIAAGKLKIHIHKSYPLADAAQAHCDLESRGTTGKLLISVQP